MKTLLASPFDPEDPLPAQLRSLVLQLHAQTEAAPEIFRQFCQLARAHDLAPEDFRRRLVQAGLAYARASELKAVLQSEVHCTAFLKLRDEAGSQSWKQTLAAARHERVQNETGQTTLQQLAARVAGLMYGTGQTSLQLAGGRLVLEPRTGDWESLS